MRRYDERKNKKMETTISYYSVAGINQLIAQYIGWTFKLEERENAVIAGKIEREFVLRNPAGQAMEITPADMWGTEEETKEHCLKHILASYGRCGSYTRSWDSLHPAYRKVAEIGLWMMTHGHDKLWLEKSALLRNAMLNEETPLKAATYISHMIKWYNEQEK